MNQISVFICFWVVVFFCTGANFDATGAKGRTILFLAVIESSLNCMELLLKNGCKSNIRDNHGFTILRTIFKTNSIIKAEAIKLLQKFGKCKLYTMKYSPLSYSYTNSLSITGDYIRCACCI